jgi:hypothetical protein
MSGFDPRTLYEGSQVYESGGLYDGWQYKGANPGPWRVELGVDLATNGIGNWFTFDDPIKGELDNPTYLLSGDVFVDITRYVRGLSVKRGRSRLLEKFITGACEVRLDNRDRLFDPQITGAPFTGQIVPRKAVRVLYNNEFVFTGNVADWDFEYDFSDAVAVVKVLDAFDYLSSRNVAPQTMTTELTGARINYVLDGAGWGNDARNIDAGTASVGADVVGENVNVLNYLQKIETSQNGLLFITKDGLVRFEDNFRGIVNATVFGGESGVPYTNIEVIYGSEELVNELNVKYLSGSVAADLTLQDLTSQDRYGVFEQSYDTLLSSSVAAQFFGETIITRYAQPNYRVDGLTFNVRGLNSADREYMMDLELGNRVRLEFRPLNVGETINRTVLVDSIDHQVTPSSHIMQLSLTDLGEATTANIASGGVISEYTDGVSTWRLHRFDTPGSYDLEVTVPGTVEALIVAAGGDSSSGSVGSPGGGGGGGLLSGSITFSSASTYPVIVGSYATGASGENSSIGSFVAFGGGKGGSNGGNALSGGSGGGGSGNDPTFGLGASATQISYGTMTGYGNVGASAYSVGGENRGGGGGGAGAAAIQFQGGVGFSSSISGVDSIYAPGGAGEREGSFGLSIPVVPNPGSGKSWSPQIQWLSLPHGIVFIRYEI